MLTIKHIEYDGNYEGVHQARETMFNPVEKVFTGFGCPGPDEGARKDGVTNWSTGTIYVMNESGKTVAVYKLNK